MEDEKKIKVKGDDLTRKHIYAYGIGHVLNDIVSACWFNFLSYYLIQVRCIDSLHAGIILLVARAVVAAVFILIRQLRKTINKTFILN